MQFSIITSSLLHVGFIILTVLGLPIFNSPAIDIPPIVQIEILEITEKTNIPEISKREIEEKKDDNKTNDGTIEKKEGIPNNRVQSHSASITTRQKLF